MAIDNYSKWAWTRVIKSCSSRNVVKLLDNLVESDGVPRSIKVDIATAFKSTEFRSYSARLNLVVKYSTPYVHTPIGVVERNIRTIEGYLKSFLLEDNNLKRALSRATKTIRFAWSSSTNRTPFELYHGRKPRTILSNIVDLEPGGKELVENIVDKHGNQLTQVHYSTKYFEGLAKERKFGKSANTQELQREIRKRKVSKRYFVVKNRNANNLASKFETRVRPLVAETKHTVSDGMKVFHKKDVAEVHNSVMSNQVDLQAKEIAERVNQKFKNVKGGDGGRFAKKRAKGVIEPLTAKGGRKILMSESDSEPEPTMKRRQKNKTGASSATKTGTTPPSSPRKRRENVEKASNTGDNTGTPMEAESTEFATAQESTPKTVTLKTQLKSLPDSR